MAVNNLIFTVRPTVVTGFPGRRGWEVHHRPRQLTEVASGDGALPPWAGLAVYAGYAAVTLTAAAVLLNRRDA